MTGNQSTHTNREIADFVTAFLCGSSQTHDGTSMPPGEDHIIRAPILAP